MAEKEWVANLEELKQVRKVLAAFKVTAEAFEKSGDRGFMIVYKLARKVLTLEDSRLMEAVEQAIEYFDQRADAQTAGGRPSPIPNEEMRLGDELRNTLTAYQEANK